MAMDWSTFCRFGDFVTETASMQADWPEPDACARIFAAEGEDALRLREVLAAKALLAGDACPAFVREALRQGHPSPCGLAWEEAFAMRWTETAVPLWEKGTENGRLAYFLLGLMPAGAPSPEPSFCSMAQSACTATRQALRFAFERTGRRFAVAARHSACEFEGASLGLPLWLGAVSLAEGRSMSGVLATGALNDAGRLVPVEGIAQKAGLRDLAGAKRFVYPASSAERVPAGGFPIHQKEDAVFLLDDVDERFWRTIHPFSYDPQFFWHQLPSIAAWRNKDEVRLALRYASLCGSMEQAAGGAALALSSACDFLEKFKGSLPEESAAMMALFPLEWAGAQEKSVDLFRICQLHITSLSHKSGDISAWADLAESCRQAVQGKASSVSPKFLEFYARKYGSFHNAFFFGEQEELLAKMREERERFRAYRERAVGKACGILCAAAAFRQEFTEALRLAKESAYNFGDDMAGRLDALRRESDRAYIYWDMGDMEKACAHAKEYIRVSEEAGENRGFVHVLKARIQAEGRQRAPSAQAWAASPWREEAFRGEVLSLLEAELDHSHTWPLYFYNAALALQDDSCLSLRCMERSRLLFTSGWARGGRLTAIAIMGLLPLSLLAEREGSRKAALDEAALLLDSLRSSVAEEEEADTAMKEGRFSRKHFADLLACSHAADALRLIREDTRRFFPFSYR